MEIIPAIMPDSYDDLVAKASRVSGLVPLAQIDVMDGVFVPSMSWPYASGGTAGDPHFVALARQEESMPQWEALEYEIDLMIAEPERHIDEWLPLGASRLIFHIESIRDLAAFWGHDIYSDGARDAGSVAQANGEKVVAIGIALNPETPIALIEPYVGMVDFVQCMGIAKIGYQGEPFDDRVLAQVNALRVKYPNVPISVDGGVNKETAPLLKAAGATRLVAGSAIFGATEASLAIEALMNA